jgi:hypothetical protein
VRNPFAGRLKDDEQELVERTHAERKAAQAEEERRVREAVVSQHETGRRSGAVTVIEITFDVDDGGTVRRVSYEHLFGPRAAEHYKPVRPAGGRALQAGAQGRGPDRPGRPRRDLPRPLTRLASGRWRSPLTATASTATSSTAS